MKRLTKKQILEAKDVRTVDVFTPEWAPEGSTPEQIAEYGVTIRSLTGAARGVFIQNSLEMKKKQDANQRVDFEVEMLLVCMTAIDEDGKLLFDQDDVKVLAEKSAAPITRCAEAASALSGLTKQVQEEAGKN